MNWLRRKWCEFSHVGHWTGEVQCFWIEERFELKMHCSWCGRTWSMLPPTADPVTGPEITPSRISDCSEDSPKHP